MAAPQRPSAGCTAYGVGSVLDSVVQRDLPWAPFDASNRDQ